MRRVIVAIILGLSIFSFSIPILPVKASAPSNLQIETQPQSIGCCASQNATINTWSGSFSTVYFPDLILFSIFEGTCGPIVSITDTFGSVYFLRWKQSGLSSYYALSTTSGSDTITVYEKNGGGCSTTIAAGVIAVAGVIPNKLFSLNIPVISDVNTGTKINGTANIPNEGDMIFAHFAANGDVSGSFTSQVGGSQLVQAPELVMWYYGFGLSPGAFGQLSHSTGPFWVNMTYNENKHLVEIIDPVNSVPIPSGSAYPSNKGFASVPGPGGLPVPPQLADQGVLGLMGIIAAMILLSSVPTVERRKKRKDSFA